MDKKAKSNAHVAFLESIPSQLRTAYLGMKQKMNAKLPTHAARDPDKDLQHVVDGGAFEYVPFEKLCRNVFEPEECYLRLDATGCKLILEMVASEVSDITITAQHGRTARPTPCAGTIRVSAFWDVSAILSVRHCEQEKPKHRSCACSVH